MLANAHEKFGRLELDLFSAWLFGCGLVLIIFTIIKHMILYWTVFVHCIFSCVFLVSPDNCDLIL